MFRELVCMIVGEGAVAAAKCEFGKRMCILGIDVTTTEAGYSFQPSAGKAKSWTEFIAGVLKRKRLMPHEADKLSGG